ncbi:methyl-CpG-binding domain protein 3a isoform X1 [Periophthalmus magnuspinnatus]|uniref:methyl-CpG-binding domain protein 3a isoform X1 n=1 Tax=Periophthalmus magnuspinnatus TaxID=409849 RepID=UPI00145B8D98|nr:methyl-CpG-binding domain protein 3a isoform X1 [Periophthalmus magnuspinnatus]
MDRKCIPVKHFLNKPQIIHGFGNASQIDADSSSHVGAGRLLQTKAQHYKQRNAYNPTQIKTRLDLNTTLPVRQTASIFKQPVTKVTKHPKNTVKTDLRKAKDPPKQLFWERKLSGLSAFNIAEELIKTIDLPKGLQGKKIISLFFKMHGENTILIFMMTVMSLSLNLFAGVGLACSDETLLSAIASALHTSGSPITGQLTTAVDKNPGVWLNTAQPLCKAFVVTDEDIRKQEKQVQSVRRRLEEALMADSLAHLNDLTSDETAGGQDETVMQMDPKIS